MPPKIITRYELSDTLNNYSKNNIRKLYEYEGAVYYFDIHFYTELLEDGYLSFNHRQAKVVVLFQDKLIDFNIVFKQKKWAVESTGKIDIPKSLLTLILEGVKKI
jgi:hypothetical protein